MAALARVERTDFLSPVCIGEVAHVSAEITYTSKHSVEVQVNVMSENIVTGTRASRRLTRDGQVRTLPAVASRPSHLRPHAAGGNGAQAG